MINFIDEVEKLYIQLREQMALKVYPCDPMRSQWIY